MELIAVIGVTVCAAFLAVLLRRHNPEYSLAISLGAGILVLVQILTQITPVITQLNEMLTSAALPGEYGKSLFKAIGICILTQLAVDSCRDAGETSMGEKAALAGKVCLLLIALPMFERIAETVTGLISGG